MPASVEPSTSRRHPYFWVAAAALPVCVIIYAGGAIAVWRYGNYEQPFGWRAAAGRHGLLVASVDSGGAADGKLIAGEAITSVSAGVIPPVGDYRQAAPSDRPYRVHSGSSEIELTAPIVWTGRRAARVAVLFGAMVFAAVGLFLGLARPDLPAGRLLSIALVGIGFNQLMSSLDVIIGQLPRVAQLVCGTLALLPGIANALTYHAVTRLPGPSLPRAVWPAGGILLYALGGATFATFGIPAAMLWWSDVDDASHLMFRWSSWFGAGTQLRPITELLSSVGLLVVLGWKLWFVRDPEERRRLRWMFTGGIVAVVPFALYKIVQTALVVSGDPGALLDSPVRTVANAAVAVGPLALGYAVAKHHVLDITVVVRRGLQYLLARNALTFILALPAFSLAYAAILNQNRTIRDTLLDNPSYLALIGAGVLALKYRGTLRERLDRAFFREAYDRERILLTLLDDISRLDSMEEVAARVGAELEGALHPQDVSILVRTNETAELTVAHRSGHTIRSGAFHPDHSTIAALERSPRATQWSSDPAGVELMVPATGGDGRLSALLMLGPKKSEEPYGPSERELLEAIARQVASVSENLRLRERVDEERRIRDQVVNRLEGRAINVLKQCPRCGACYDGSAVRCADDGVELTIPLPVERTIDGQYRLDRLIGKGGMGAVYEAEDLRLQRKVAIKVFVGRGFGEQTALRRFEREAQICARMNHHNIVTVFDSGTVPAGAAYLVMERLYGDTLRNELTRTGWMQPDAAAEVFEQILEGVKTAHAHGVIHRDLKPENVIIVGGNAGTRRIKLLDFGVARMVSNTAVTETATLAGVVVGTLGYMAPEQFAGTVVDERADIFAFGIMLAEALTGTRPFDRPTYAAVLSSMHLEQFHLQGDPATTPALDAALQRCLARDPKARFASAAEVQRYLIPALRACPPNSISKRNA